MCMSPRVWNLCGECACYKIYGLQKEIVMKKHPSASTQGEKKSHWQNSFFNVFRSLLTWEDTTMLDPEIRASLN